MTLDLADKHPDDWPAPLPGLGRIWACASQSDATAAFAAVKLTAVPGLPGAEALATLYGPAEFRDLVRHLQAVADQLPEES